MDLEVRHLQLVEAVSALGSLTKAGERLHLTQSALSHQLRDIETRLGTPIFLRVSKRMVLTPSGERLLDSARLILDQLRQAEQAVRDLAHDRQGLLRICTECYTCYHWLPALLKEFHAAYPRVEVRIDVEATSRPMEKLLDGQLDLAVMSCVSRHRLLVTTPLFRDEMVVIAAPGHRLASKPFVRAGDFADEVLYTYATKEESTVYQKILLPAGVAPRALHQVKLTEAIVEMVKAGLGVSVLARWSVQPHLDAGTLRGIPLTPRGFYRQWSAVVVKHLAAVPYVLEFIRLLAARNPAARTSGAAPLAMTAAHRGHEKRPLVRRAASG